MKRQILVFIFIVSSLVCVRTWGQIAPKIVLGQPSLKELEMTHCPFDSAADAVILYERTDNRGTDIIVHKRIKILKPSGLQPNYYGTFSETIHKKRLMTKMEGYVYNFEDNQIKTETLSLKNIVTSSNDGNYNKVKIEAPTAKVGSVIEIRYVIEYYFLYYHNFQHAIPTLWSEVQQDLPDGVDVSLLGSNQGKLAYQKIDRHTNYNLINVAMYDVKAFKSEPYDYDAEKYKARLIFKVIRGGDVLLTESAKDIVRLNKLWFIFNENEHISNVAKDILKTVANPTDTVACFRAAMEWVRQEIKYDLKEVYEKDTEPKTIIKRKKGSHYQQSIVLFAIVRAMGFSNVEWAMLRGRQKTPLTEKSVSNDIDFEVPYAKIGGKDLYLDVRNENGRVGMLHPDWIGTKAYFLKSEKEGEFRDMNVSDKWQKLVQAETIIDPTTEKATAKGKLTAAGYYGLLKRDQIAKDGEEDMLIKFKKIDEKMPISKAVITNQKDLDKPLEIEFEGDMSQLVTFTSDRILVNPAVHFYDKNPFVAETRDNPIDFNYALSYNINHSIKIPAGYVVESMPKGMTTGLPNNDAKFTYTAEEKDGSVRVSIRLNINRAYYDVGAYGSIKQLFEAMVKKVTEEIVFKKQ